MLSKTIAARAYPAMQTNHRHLENQRGVTLVELMVGIAIGLLVVAMAMSALMVSRGVTGTVSDASSIQQQAAYAMRIIGKQLRQTGSLELDLSPGTTAADISYLEPVAFVIKDGDFDAETTSIEGKDNPGSNEYKLSTGYSNYKEKLFPDGAEDSLARDCLGASPSDTLIQSNFILKDGALRCASASGTAQPIIDNVADFQVRYLLQENVSTGNPTIRYVDAATVGDNWPRVQAVEVCLVLYGAERIDMPAGSSYAGCDGTAVDMTTLTGTRAQRMHLAFRNVFQLRSQGLIGTIFTEATP